MPADDCAVSPQPQDGRPAVQHFESSELLYRRFLKPHFEADRLLPAAFAFPRQSFNRGRFSRAEDVIHSHCGDSPGSDFSGWGVMHCCVADLPGHVAAGDGKQYCFFAKHVPLPTCYAHSELWCALSADPERNYREPSTIVKEKLRIALARSLVVLIAAQR